MKIVLIIPKFLYGGAEIMTKHLAIALKETKNDVTVVSLYKDGNTISDELLQNNIKVVFFDKHKGIDLHIIIKLAKLFKHINPDVVHTHLSALFYVFFAAKIAGVKKIVHTFHNLAEKNIKLSYILYKMLFKFGEIKLVAINFAVKKSLSEVYKIDSKKIFIVNNGEYLKDIVVKGCYSFNETINILHVGRFNASKNHNLLLDAFKEIVKSKPNVNLILFGEGELDNKIHLLVHKYKLEKNVIFAGVTNGLRSILYKYDIFILPSKEEGMPMTIIEAMAAGLPIIASDVGGIPEMISNYINGILIKPKKEDIITTVLLLINNEELRYKIGKQAVKDSIKFSSEAMAKGYIDIYSG